MLEIVGKHTKNFLYSCNFDKILIFLSKKVNFKNQKWTIFIQQWVK